MLYKPTCLLCVHCTSANRAKAQWMTLFHESHIHWLSGHSGEMGWTVNRWVGSGFWGVARQAQWVKYIEVFVWKQREVCPEWFHFSSACKLDMQPVWTMFKTSIMEAAALLHGQRVVGACHGGSQRAKGGADWKLKLSWRGLSREELVDEWKPQCMQQEITDMMDDDFCYIPKTFIIKNKKILNYNQDIWRMIVPTYAEHVLFAFPSYCCPTHPKPSQSGLGRMIMEVHWPSITCLLDQIALEVCRGSLSCWKTNDSPTKFKPPNSLMSPKFWKLD